MLPRTHKFPPFQQRVKPLRRRRPRTSSTRKDIGSRRSVSHGDAVEQATGALRHHFRDLPDVLVAMELVVYYRRGNNRVWLQPDVQVVHGVGRSPSRSTYRVWEEGKAPDFVLEVASPSTADNDAQHKVGEYASLGVREYWRLDPVGALMATSLEGYEASAGGYEPVPEVAVDGRIWLRSAVLGLDLRGERRDRSTVLVFGTRARERSGPARQSASGRPQKGGSAPQSSEQTRQKKKCGYWRSDSGL